MKPHTENFFSTENINDLVEEAVTHCYRSGAAQESRNGETKSLFDATMELTDPTQRYLNLPWRKSNIFQLMFETLWVLAGEEELGHLEVFLPRARQYSDDGETWHDAYGPRIMGSKKYGYSNQLQDALNLLKADINTRRAFISIFDPQRDTQTARQLVGVESPKAIPCNDGIFFWVENDHLNMKVVQRSGDLFFGAGSINLFEFSVIHEMMFEFLKEEHPQLKMGVYRHNSINLHLYTGMKPVKAQLDNLKPRGFFCVDQFTAVGNSNGHPVLRMDAPNRPLGVSETVENHKSSGVTPSVAEMDGFDFVKEMAVDFLGEITESVVKPPRVVRITPETTLLERFMVYSQLFYLNKTEGKSFEVEFTSPGALTQLEEAVVASPFRKFGIRFDVGV